MMRLSCNKSMSLLERKRLQWAEERAEMESLRSPWSLPPPAYNIKLSESQSRFASSLEIRTTCPSVTQQDLLPRRQRSPSLPPILKCQTLLENSGDQLLRHYDSSYRPANYRCEEAEGETSGYASEAAPQTSPELWATQQTVKSAMLDIECQCDSQPCAVWQYDRSGSSGGRRHSEDNTMQVQIQGETRPKWGDKGVAAGRLWEPHDGAQRLPQSVPCRGPPSWVERGLSSMDTQQMILLEHATSCEDKLENAAERLTHLLGQNVPIESSIKAERECKRLKALELQAAIIQQLEERKQKKKAEKERRMKEDREEEERFKKQKDLELQRLQEEKKLSEEKQQREQKRAEALRQALENAEKQAKAEKENNKMKKLRDNFDAMSVNLEPAGHNKFVASQQSSPCKESKLIQNIFIEQTAFSPRKKTYSASGNAQSTPPAVAEPRMMTAKSQSSRFSTGKVKGPDKVSPSKSQSVQRDESESSRHSHHTIESLASLVPVSVPHDMFTPVHIAPSTGVQMAFLVPQHVYQCVHPIGVQPLYQGDVYFQQSRNMFHASVESDDCTNCSNRIITPSKYKNPNSRDVSTQTDFENIETENSHDSLRTDKKKPSLDTTVEQHASDEKLSSSSNKKVKRSSLEDKYKELERRPKWGVNKPPTQYKKQSEKDIFYSQKRKLRTRKRNEEKKQYTSQSSDENRSPSPSPCSIQQAAKTLYKLQRGRISSDDSYWRKSSKCDSVFSDVNVDGLNVETTEISALECDRTGVVRICNNTTSTNTREATPQGKKMTLSQKFMNDKYGNPKIWNDDEDPYQRSGEKNVQRRKHNLDVINKAKKEQSRYFCDSNKPVILDQIKSLKNSLMKQQLIWGKYGASESVRTPSPTDEVDVELE